MKTHTHKEKYNKHKEQTTFRNEERNKTQPDTNIPTKETRTHKQ